MSEPLYVSREDVVKGNNEQSFRHMVYLELVKPCIKNGEKTNGQ